MSYINNISIGDSANLDAFSRLRVSQPENIFNVQCQYSKATIQMENGATGTGVTPAHDINTRMVTLSATAGSGTSFMQSFQYSPYQPGISHFIAVTFVLSTAVAATTVDVGYFDSLNGIFLRQNGATNYQIIRRSSTSGSVVDVPIAQSSWNVDKFDGNGPSGHTIDLTKCQILVIDLQFLGMGRVRVGFDIDGSIHYAHEFLNANSLSVPYMQQATLPIQILLTATSSATTKTSYFKCATINAEGGNLDLYGYLFATPDVTATAGSGAKTAILSVRPKTTFNSIPNREYFEILDIQMITTGANPVYWELCIGNTFSVAPTWADINTTNSAYEYTSAPGTYSGTGTVIANGYINGTGGGSSPSTVTPIILPSNLSRKFPISLDRAGAVRALGTLNLIVTGIGGASAVRATMNFKEVR